MARLSLSLWLVTLTSVALSSAFTINATPRSTSVARAHSCPSLTVLFASEKTATTSPPPVLNGKMVLPLSVVRKGLEGHSGVAAVFALIGGGSASETYKRGSDGWKQVVKVGTTLDLAETLTEEDEATHVRALSFSFPQQGAMNDMAQQWKESVKKAGGVLQEEPLARVAESGDVDDLLRTAQQNAMKAFDDDDDEDDDDDIEMMMPPPPSRSGDVISPFADGASTTIGKDLPFNAESVNKVLDEVRPYLIADGGNVSVDRVDVETKNVYLKLEGACGSCASSTVTMQMGIERVLKENFEDLGQVIQIEEDGKQVASQLSQDMVLLEMNRIGPAISAMGGQYELVGVDSELGVVEVKFKGPNKLQQGLELALMDIPLCNKVQFTMFD